MTDCGGVLAGQVNIIRGLDEVECGAAATMQKPAAVLTRREYEEAAVFMMNNSTRGNNIDVQNLR